MSGDGSAYLHNFLSLELLESMQISRTVPRFCNDAVCSGLLWSFVPPVVYGSGIAVLTKSGRSQQSGSGISPDGNLKSGATWTWTKDQRVMRAVAFHITQYYPTAMSKMIKSLRLKCYWILSGFDGGIYMLVHHLCTNLCIDIKIWALLSRSELHRRY